jgi:hypothetical protein
MCVNEAGSIRLMEEKDVEQVEELEKQCFSVPWSENILKDGLTGRFDTYLVWEKHGIGILKVKMPYEKIVQDG